MFLMFFIVLFTWSGEKTLLFSTENKSIGLNIECSCRGGGAEEQLHARKTRTRTDNNVENANRRNGIQVTDNLCACWLRKNKYRRNEKHNKTIFQIFHPPQLCVTYNYFMVSLGVIQTLYYCVWLRIAIMLIKFWLKFTIIKKHQLHYVLKVHFLFTPNKIITQRRFGPLLYLCVHYYKGRLNKNKSESNRTSKNRIIKLIVSILYCLLI